VGGSVGETSVRSCQKLCLCPIEQIPAGSQKDPLLAKAEPCSLCENMFKKAEKNCCTTADVRLCERNSSRSVKEWEEVLHVLVQRFPCNLWSRSW